MFQVNTNNYKETLFISVFFPVRAGDLGWPQDILPDRGNAVATQARAVADGEAGRRVHVPGFLYRMHAHGAMLWVRERHPAAVCVVLLLPLNVKGRNVFFLFLTGTMSFAKM